MNDDLNNENNEAPRSFINSLLSKIPHILFVFIIIFGVRYCSNQDNFMDNYKSTFISACNGTNQYLDPAVKKQTQNIIDSLSNPSKYDDYCECSYENITNKYSEEALKRIEKKASGDLTESEIKEFYGEINLDNYQSQINKLVNNDPELIEFFNYNEQSLNNCLYIID